MSHTFFLSRPHWPALSYLTTPSSYEETGKCAQYPEWLFCPAKNFIMEDRRRYGVGFLAGGGVVALVSP